jgi:hypothetical protein
VLAGELHGLAQYEDGTPGPARGFRFERRIADGLARRGFPVRAVPGGVEIFGVLPASGLLHQMDAEIRCADADVIGEWKCYVGAIPKNEVLLFKAKTDDLFDALLPRPPKRPLFRFFGMAGDATRELRIYAARHGIGLIERSRWPACVLQDPFLDWPRGEGPGTEDLRRLDYLCRPMQSVVRTRPGGVLLARPLSAVTADALIATHDRWSDRLDTLTGVPRKRVAA